MNIRTLLLLIILIAGQSGCAQNVPSQRPPLGDPAYDQKLQSLLRFNVPLIGVEELENIQNEVVIFDTRKREEYAVSHIPGARFLGYQEDFAPNRLQGISKEQLIVLYCSVGYRSEKIGARLRQRGYTNIYNLYGSIFEWVNQERPLVDTTGAPTIRLHTYNRNWSRWVTNPKVEKTW